MSNKTYTRYTLTALVALLALLLVPSVSAETVSVRLTEPFEVAGQVFDSGKLTVKEVSRYSPVATLNEVCVGSNCLGLFLAREFRGASTASGNKLIFGRSADGHLVLEAVALAGGPTRGLYEFEVETAEWHAVRQRTARDTLSASTH